MAFNTPISTSAPAFSSSTNKITTPSNWWGPNITFPYPTNAWFMDFVIAGMTDMVASRSDRRTTVWPYLIRAQDDGLAFNKPFIRTYADGRTIRNEHQINYHATATNYGWTSAESPATWRYIDLSLKSTETIATRYLDTFDQLSATLRWNVDASHYMSAPVVKGMPYVTMRYNQLTPTIRTDDTEYHAITTVNGSAPTGTVSGTKFTFTVSRPYLGNGATEKWIVYSSSSITFNVSSQGFTATAPFTGYVRVAVVPSGTAGQETVLDTYKDAVPVGGSTSVAVSGNTSTTTFTYSKIGTGSTLLTYSFPHHEATLSSPTYVSAITIPTIRGTLKAVAGNTWNTTQTLSTITWDSPQAIDPGKLSAINAAFDVEKDIQTSDIDGTEAYIFGKQISRAGRLALIAHQLGDTTARDAIITKMKSAITPWLTNVASSGAPASFLYDSTWGGVLDNGAYISSPPNDPYQATGFGNPVYNDHYFHWGYFIYGAAVIARFDSSWGSTYRTRVNDVIRDIANPSPDGDPYFTQLRHYDWYEGHSWAAGLQANGDGRNQESTSEAVNAWYGINLWGLATGQSDLRNVGRWLQAMETQAAQLYWQMPSYNDVYPASFAQQKVIPLLFANKAFNGTWFGLADDILVGIETLPFTPASHELLPKTWMQETYPAVLADNASTSTAYAPGGWLGYTYAAQALVDPSAAFTNINALAITGDNQYIDKFGASKTNLLWWSAVQGTTTSTVSTTTTLSVSPSNSAAPGATVTLSASVNPAVAGSIVFKDGTTTINTVQTSGGTASTTTSSLAQGAHALTATFVPTDTGAYTGSSSSTTNYTITGGSSATQTSVALAASPASTATEGSAVSLTATITPTAAAGSVAFRDGVSTIATVTVSSGSAATSTSSLAVGARSLSAVFTPTNSGTYTSSTSSTINYTVTATGGGGGDGGGSTGSNFTSTRHFGLAIAQPIAATRIGISDTNYTATGSDTIIAYRSLTTSRTVTLPAASQPGRQLIIKDETGDCASGRSITIQGTIDGSATTVLQSAFAHIVLYDNGTSWSKIV